MPKLSYYQKKGEPTPLEQVGDEKARKKILEAVRATEIHMALSCIAMGILQCLSISLTEAPGGIQLRYQRTPARGRISEAAVMHYLRRHIFRLMAKQPGLCITQIIHEHQEQSGNSWDSLAS